MTENSFNVPDGMTAIELYGPEDGGWYTTRVHDWIALCPLLKDVDVRGYLILRSLVIEKYKNPVRKMTLAVLGDLIPGVNGKENSLGRVRGVIGNLTAVGLVTTPEGDPVRTSSRAAAAQRVLRLRINDLPCESYQGWRNTEVKLAFVTAERDRHEAGQNSDPASSEGSGTQGAGQNFDPAGENFDPRGRNSDPDPGAEQPEREVPLVPSFGTATGGDALAARSAGDGRRPSDGSSVREAEGGSAASTKDQPSPVSPEPPVRDKGGGSKTRHTRQQLDVVRAVRAHFPAELNPPNVPTLSNAVLQALAEGRPDSRTVEQLGVRIQRRWYVHGWARRVDEGETLTSPIGVAIDLVRSYGRGDKWGCAAPRCEDGVDIDTGEDCTVCPERLADRQAAPRAGGARMPGPRHPQGSQGFRECPCGNPIQKSSDDDLCRGCRKLQDALTEARHNVHQAAEAPF